MGGFCMTGMMMATDRHDSPKQGRDGTAMVMSCDVLGGEEMRSDDCDEFSCFSSPLRRSLLYRFRRRW
jgi:hypothetical protein